MSVSPFAAALAAADVVIDAQMGEDISIIPCVPGDFGAVPDSERPAFDVVGLVYETDPSAADAGSMMTRLPYEEWEIEVRREHLAGRRVRKGDEVLLLDRPGSPRFVVSRIDDVDRSRIIMALTSIGGE